MEQERLQVPTLGDWRKKSIKESATDQGLDLSINQGTRVYLTGLEVGHVFRIVYQDDRRELFVNLNNQETEYPGRYFKLDDSQANNFKAGDEVKVLQSTIFKYTDKEIEEEVLYSLHPADYPVPNKFKR